MHSTHVSAAPRHLGRLRRSAVPPALLDGLAAPVAPAVVDPAPAPEPSVDPRRPRSAVATSSPGRRSYVL